MIYTQSDIDRFWSQVQIGSEDQCWLWTGACDKDGYGCIYIDKKMMRCARLSIMITYNIDPGKNLVLHTCDNPPCCNLNHLYIGTHSDNANDFLNRKYQYLLTKSQIQEIRLKRFMGIMIQELAQEFNVSRSTIIRAINSERGY